MFFASGVRSRFSHIAQAIYRAFRIARKAYRVTTSHIEPRQRYIDFLSICLLTKTRYISLRRFDICGKPHSIYLLSQMRIGADPFVKN